MPDPTPETNTAPSDTTLPSQSWLSRKPVISPAAPVTFLNSTTGSTRVRTPLKLPQRSHAPVRPSLIWHSTGHALHTTLREAGVPLETPQTLWRIEFAEPRS